MTARVALLFFAQALLIQCVYNQRPGVGTFGLGGRGWPYEGLITEGMGDPNWNRGLTFENPGFFPQMEIAAATNMLAPPANLPGLPGLAGVPAFETYESVLASEMPYLGTLEGGIPGMNFGFNTPMMDPMMPEYPIMVDPVPVINEPVMITEAINPIAPIEEIRPVGGIGPTIAPSASLAVVVMDSSIQNLFENLWNVRQ